LLLGDIPAGGRHPNRRWAWESSGTWVTSSCKARLPPEVKVKTCLYAISQSLKLSVLFKEFLGIAQY